MPHLVEALEKRVTLSSDRGAIVPLVDRSSPPIIRMTAPDVRTSGGGRYLLRVGISDPDGVRLAENDPGMSLVGPAGYRTDVRLLERDESFVDGVFRAAYVAAPPGGAWDVSDNGEYRIVVGAGRIGDTRGNFVPPGTLARFTVAIPNTGYVRGVVVRDAMADGVVGVGDSGQAGVRVYLDADLDGRWDPGELVALSDGAGNYELRGVPVGVHRVREVVPWRWQQATPASGYYDVTIRAAGRAVAGLDFHNFRHRGVVRIGGTTGADRVVVSREGGEVRVAVNGKLSRFDASALRGVYVYGGAGDDDLSVRAGFDVPVRLLGGAGDDSLLGGAAGDLLRGGPDSDDLFGGDGDDTLHGDGGSNRIDAGSGDDLVLASVGSAGESLVLGGDGADTLVGGERGDTLRGGAGNDKLSAPKGIKAHQFFGDGGDDEIYAKNIFADVIDGGAGLDWAWIDRFPYCGWRDCGPAWDEPTTGVEDVVTW